MTMAIPPRVRGQPTPPKRYHYRVVIRYLHGVGKPVDGVLYAGKSEELAREYLAESQPGVGFVVLLQRVPHEAWETVAKKDFDDFIGELKARQGEGGVS